MNKCLTIALALVFTLPLAAQRHRTLLGIGSTHQADTYLSPLMYRGTQFAILHQTTRNTRFNPSVNRLTRTSLVYAPLHHQKGFVAEHSMDANFAFGYDYEWKEVAHNFSLALGGVVDTRVGGTYNRRNGNNPGQLRLSSNIGLLARAQYIIGIKKKTCPLHYELSLPLLGGMFSPQYGQSYYNIFGQHNYDHNVVATHFGNCRYLRQQLTIDIPCKKKSLTIGYLADIQQSHVHGITQKETTHNFLIGWSL